MRNSKEKTMSSFQTFLTRFSLVCSLAFTSFVSTLQGQIHEKPLCDDTRKARVCEKNVKVGSETYKVEELFGKDYVFEIVNEGNIQKNKPVYIGNEVEQCLIEKLSCNESIEVATALTAATQPKESGSLPTALPPNQQFFLAHSFYRLQLETRSQVLRCAYGNRAKSQIKDFLSAAKQHTDQGGNLLALNIGHIQAAMNMMKQLDAPNDCPNQPLTLGDIASIVQDFASQQIIVVFTSKKNQDANPVKDALEGIFSMVQGFMSTVAEVESAVQLLDVEILANNNKLVRIANGPLKSLYCQDSAECKAIQMTIKDNTLTSVKLESAATPKVLADARTKNRIYAAGAIQISEVEKRISQLIAKAYSCYAENKGQDCSGIEQAAKSASEGYNELRLRLTSDTYYWAEQATRQDYYLRELLTGSANSGSSFKDLVKTLNERDQTDDPLDVVQELQQSFEARFGTNCPDYPSWFCCNLNPSMPFCKK